MSWSTPWAEPGKAAPFLPMSRAEMDVLGWDACDVVLVTGDAYVDHPSFGMAIIGRLLEAQGFRVGIIAQPDWQSAEPFKALGQPTLFFGVTGGNMDSMVNRYTSDRRLRHNDSYTPDGEGGKRPDRCRHRLRAALPRGVPRRADRARRHRGIAAPHRALRLLVRQGAPLDPGRRQGRHPALRQRRARRGRGRASPRRRRSAARARRHPRRRAVRAACRRAGRKLHADDLDAADEGAAPASAATSSIRLPSFEQVAARPEAYARASRVLHRESNPGNARAAGAAPRRPRTLADAAADPADHRRDGRGLRSALRARAASVLRRRQDSRLGHDHASR